MFIYLKWKRKEKSIEISKKLKLIIKNFFFFFFFFFFFAVYCGYKINIIKVNMKNYNNDNYIIQSISNYHQ